MLFNSPMEQFLIVPLSSSGFLFNFSNNLVYLILSVFFLFIILLILSFESGSLKGFVFTKNAGLLSLVSFFLEFIKDLSESILGSFQGVRAYPFFGGLFFFIFVLNFMGIMPYAFTVTSHLSSTFSLSFALLVGTTILMFQVHGKHAFSFFLPSGAPFAMVLFLVPIEVLSYLIRFVSLPVRLFANMMSGHILLKVFVGLGSTLLASKNMVGFIASFVPLIVLVLLLFLEIGVALVQAYVFCLLMLMFLNDSYALH
jgi:ATP synthase subunit 6